MLPAPLPPCAMSWAPQQPAAMRHKRGLRALHSAWRSTTTKLLLLLHALCSRGGGGKLKISGQAALCGADRRRMREPCKKERSFDRRRKSLSLSLSGAALAANGEEWACSICKWGWGAPASALGGGHLSRTPPHPTQCHHGEKSISRNGILCIPPSWPRHWMTVGSGG